MPEPELPEPVSEDARTAVSAAEAEPEPAEPEPEPEPWTPERVVEWNAYYDLYVAIGVVFLVFATSANKITHTSLWTWLQAGRTMAARTRPLVTDLFSYTETWSRWVNIPWLFQWSHAVLFDAVRSAMPINPADPLGAQFKQEYYGAAALVALTALARMATVYLLLAMRRPGPGLWWSAVAAGLGFGAFLVPGGVSLGGVAGSAMVAPDTWGTLLLALLLFLWYRALELGRAGALWGLVPVFLVWANTDESFLVGLCILAAGIAGLRANRKDAPLPRKRRLLLVGACVLVCLVNPSFYRIFPAAISSLSHPFQLSPLRPQRLPAGLEQIGWWIAFSYLVSVALGFGSFALNRRRFSWSRFLMFSAAAALWGAYLSERALFAVVFAATLAWNGQEWYHDRFGTAGRVTRGWNVFSVGGRAVTIVLTFVCVAMALTGWGKSPGAPVFGFGYDPDAFPFEMADFLRTAKIEGRVLNTTREQGDALIWRAYPSRPSFIDSREHLFPGALVDRLQSTRKALSTDDVAGWKPLLDEYKISAVIIDETSSPRTYQCLLKSRNWIPFYDDGSVVLFGRADAPQADLAFFRARRLNARSLVYEQLRTIPAPENTPTPLTWVDRIYHNSALRGPQPHTTAALHWLQTQGSEDASDTGDLPDPAHCLMAIQEARIALSHRASDTGPYRILSEAYKLLMLEESALLSGIKLTPENASAILQAEPRTNLLMNRLRQRLTALNAAIQTTSPPGTEADRQGLFTLNFQLFQLYMNANYVDLARDRLQAMLAYPPDRLEADMAANLSQQLAALNQRIKEIQDEINDLTIEQQLSQLQRAAFFRNRGAPGLALMELEEAERTGVNPTQVRPLLVDLYCDTGQPEKAQDLLSSGSLEDVSMAEPGSGSARQARVGFLLGYYESAAHLWEDNAIFRVRNARTAGALFSTAQLLRGQAKNATSMLLDLPGKVGLQATWEYDLALCQLESGRPDRAAAAFTEALTLVPDLTVRPIAAYYLEKLGKPVPPPRATKAAEVKK